MCWNALKTELMYHGIAQCTSTQQHTGILICQYGIRFIFQKSVPYTNISPLLVPRTKNLVTGFTVNSCLKQPTVHGNHTARTTNCSYFQCTVRQPIDSNSYCSYYQQPTVRTFNALPEHLHSHTDNITSKIKT